MEQPPAKCQVFPVGFEIVTVDIVVIVVIVFEGDLRSLGGSARRGERDDRREVGASAEEIELNAGEEGEEGEGIEEGECSGDGCEWGEIKSVLHGVDSLKQIDKTDKLKDHVHDELMEKEWVM